MTESWRADAERLRDLKPGSFLFLCVANSARSQMAEGVARMLAPDHVRIASAGSQPTAVRPEAVAVLAELGVDASAHTSTAVADVDPATVDVVITLCADEVCPVFLGDALRLHWGLPDPAAVKGNDAARLAAFRAVRDELRRRLTVVFDG
jgi:arsenate reductase